MVKRCLWSTESKKRRVKRPTQSISQQGRFMQWYSATNEYICRWYARLSTQAQTHLRGQGTTEYAIIVGVIVVIAIVAIVGFKPKIQALWDAISNGLGSL